VTTALLHPRDLNLPPKFSSWRPGQLDSILSAFDAFDTSRFLASNDPTGAGKSVKAAALAQLLGERAVIVTSTKNLQSQYSNDFRPMGIADVRGRNNYSCDDYGTCAEGRLLGCEANREGNCEYVNDLNHFLTSPLGVTNYSYMLSSRLHGAAKDGIGDVGLLVLDEAHNAVQELSDALEIHLDHNKLAPFYANTVPHPPRGRALQWWQEWAKACLAPMAKCVEGLKATKNKKLVVAADSFSSQLIKISNLAPDWIVDDVTSKTETVFAPLWPTDQAKPLLFSKAAHVLLMSATIVPKTLQLLGVEESESTFLSSTFNFPRHRCPIYLFGGDRIDHRTTEAQYQAQLGRMDSLISHRLDRKGIIHSVSYERQQFIKSRSAHSAIMLAPRAKELASAIELFKSSPPPLILVSPAITTGYDFPGVDAEYQFIMKVPFLDLRGPIMKARSEDDPEYAMYLTIQTLIQMCGRLMRGPEDSSETFILDKHINWLLLSPDRGGKYRHLFTPWFLNLIQWPKVQPQPLPKLAA